MRLVPRFTPGQVLRYQLDFRTESEGTTEGDIQVFQAPKRLEVSVGAIVKVEVLSLNAAASGSFDRVRLRATYEKLASTTRGDVYDPLVEHSETQLRRLEGKSFEFTLDASGALSEITGLEEVVPEEHAAVRDWLSQFHLGIAHPPKGIVPGQKWSLDQPKPLAAPLVGFVWTTESTYLRNEPCRTASVKSAAAPDASKSDELCAVILSRFIIQRRSTPRDPTPEEYRKRGLRTAGKITGSGESLSYVSLATGFLTSVTHAGEEAMELSVTMLEHGHRVRYTGRVKTHSQITLVTESQLAPR